MVDLLPILAFFAVFVLSQRSLGWGMLGVFAVGYFSGLVRANFLSVGTSFFFDAAVAGLYLSFFLGHTRSLKAAIGSEAGQFCLLLIAWPAFLTAIPINHILVQLVSLRSNIWMLPFIIMAIRLKVRDVRVITRGLAILNLITAVVGMYIYTNGVESLYPKNYVTRIMYSSKDVSEGQHYRVPSTFITAHNYGGTMVISLPFLLGLIVKRKERKEDRFLCVLGVAAAILGILLCAARQPLWMLSLLVIVTWIQTGMSVRSSLIFAILAGGTGYVLFSNDRFQRGTTITASSLDTNKLFVLQRIYGSVNFELFELALEYPFGAGMGSSNGTSMPYFLEDLAPEPIGGENEYSKISIDQGWPGLGLWIAFIFWTLFPRPRSMQSDNDFFIRILHSTVLLFWATAFMGLGAFTAVPTSAITLTTMGVLIGERDRNKKMTRFNSRMKALLKSQKAFSESRDEKNLIGA